MFLTIQKFVRGCVIDPELEKKVHNLADEARETMRKANETLGQVQKTTDKLGNAQQIVVLAGLGLMVAGFVAGSMSTKKLG